MSEDFDMALRMQAAGYTLRYAAYSRRRVQRSVSLTVYDELARWEKYAYGCNELLFHPLRFWIFKGPFTPLFRRFSFFSCIPLPSKLTIIVQHRNVLRPRRRLAAHLVQLLSSLVGSGATSTSSTSTYSLSYISILVVVYWTGQHHTLCAAISLGSDVAPWFS